METTNPQVQSNTPPAPGILSFGRELQLCRNARGELEAKLTGQSEPVKNVKVARCFPWSLKDQFISIRDKDGKEIVLLQTLEGVDAGTQAIIEQELRDRCFVPKIVKITSYKAEFDVVTITAQTDRGEVAFQIRSRDDVRVLSAKRALFRDVDGNVYEIEDFAKLDRSSQRHLDRYF